MPRQTRSRTSSAARPVDSHVLTFVSPSGPTSTVRQRNFDRYMRVINNTSRLTAPSTRSGRRSPLRTPCGMLYGRNVMAPCPVARGFSTGKAERTSSVALHFGRHEHQVSLLRSGFVPTRVIPPTIRCNRLLRHTEMRSAPVPCRGLGQKQNEAGRPTVRRPSDDVPRLEAPRARPESS